VCGLCASQPALLRTETNDRVGDFEARGKTPGNALNTLQCAQVFLAPTPGTAWFLKPAERRWLQQRQDDSHAAAMKRTHGANSSMISGLTNWRLWYLGIVRAPQLCVRC